jgi:hypothetical protein
LLKRFFRVKGILAGCLISARRGWRPCLAVGKLYAARLRLARAIRFRKALRLLRPLPSLFGAMEMFVI